jgi:hypothetical protein
MLSVFLRKNFVSLSALLFSVAFFFFFLGLSLQFRFASAEVLFSESESGAYSSLPRKKRSRKRKGKVEWEIFTFLATVCDPDSILAVLFWDCEEGKRVVVLGEI